MYVLSVWNDVAYYDNPVCASEASCKLHLKRVIDFQQLNCRHICPMVSSTDAGSSAARLARSVRDAEVGGSNPLSPTAPGAALRRSRFSCLIPGFACDV